MSQEFENEVSEYVADQNKSEFPQYLCRTCGRCCRSITTFYSYDELKQLTEEGDEEARVFIEIFKAYPSIEDARKVVPEQVAQVIYVAETYKNIDLDKITFYYCPHITDQNLCSYYEKRPDCCRRAPRHGWSVMPPGCGFEGWQFEMRERHKKMVRKYKEYLYMMEQFSENGKILGQDKTIEELRQEIEEKIKPWGKYGASFW